MKHFLALFILLLGGVAQAQIDSVFSQRCAKCHGTHLEKPKGKLYISPTSTERDRIAQSVAQDKMPPDRPLPPEEKQIIARWAQGDEQTKEVSVIVRTVRFAGKLHILLLHFPIAIIFIVGYLELTHRNLDVFIKLMLRICATAACIAAAFGWLHGVHKISPGLYLHAGLGTAAAAACVGLDWCAHSLGRGWVYRVLLGATMGLVAAAAHFGASLIHGDQFFVW